MAAHFDVSMLEQMLLFSILRKKPFAYGVAIRDEIAAVTGRRYSVGTIYAALDRITAKGWVETALAPPEKRRGGKMKTFYSVSKPGMKALRDTFRILARLRAGLDEKFNLVPGLEPSEPAKRKRRQAVPSAQGCV